MKNLHDEDHEHDKVMNSMVDDLMEDYEVWMEGHRAQGSSSTAEFIGTFKGIDFRDACKEAMKNYPQANQYYNANGNSYWGMRLFDNASDATKSFG